MKLTFVPRDNKQHTYCINCGQEPPQQFTSAGRTLYRCKKCGYNGGRALIIDPKIKWWVDNQREYWHETSGLFVYDRKQRFLFFERNTYPFGLAVPAGHVDAGEAPVRAGQRELQEETSLRVGKQDLVLVATDNIRGDKCRRGADSHRWHAFACRLPQHGTIRVDRREGARPVWLTLGEAKKCELTFATRYVIKNHERRLLRLAS